MSSRPIVIRGWLVAYASVIHLTWALMLLLDESVINVAPVSWVASWFDDNNYATGLLYLVVGACAWVGAKLKKCNTVSLVMGLPQLVIVFIGAGECVQIALNGVHPDGTVHEHTFFLAQLAGSIWLAPVYMFSVYWPYWKAIWKSR